MQLQLDVHCRLSERFAVAAATTFEFGAGRPVAALFGPSGCGKSTLLALVAGLRLPDAGRITLDGTVLTDTAARIQLPPERRAVGLVAQDGWLFPHLAVSGNLDYAERRAGGRPHAPRDEIVEALQLAPLLGRDVTQLSGGERQRVAIGRALLAGPRLLLLDEPVSALDEASRWHVLGFVDAVTRRFGVPALYVSHQRQEVNCLAGQVARMEQGTIAESGPPETVLAGGATPGPASNLLRATFTGGAPGAAALDDGTPLQLPVDAPAGRRAWCWISSAAIGLERPAVERVSSVRNRLPGTVTSLTQEALRVRVRVEAAVPLHVDVTPQAAAELALAPGTPVVCAFKSHALTVAALPAAG